MKTLLMGLLVCVTLSVQAQFSELDQLYPFVVSTIYNPANTGNFINDRQGNDYTIARFQSNTAIEQIRQNPYLTTVGSVDGRLNVGREDYIGIGGDYQYSTALGRLQNSHLLNIRASYQKQIGRRGPFRETLLSIGIGAGVYNRASKLANYSYWTYRQQHGFSLRHVTPQNAVYQIGGSHSMYKSLGGFINGQPDSVVSSSWSHLFGLQGYGEWKLSKKWRINAIFNYNYQPETFGGLLSKHVLGGTLGVKYSLGNRTQWKLMAALGTQFILWNPYHEVARMVHTGFLGIEYNSLRLLIRVSNDYSNSGGYGFDFHTFHHVGLSIAYFIVKKPRWGGTPVF